MKLIFYVFLVLPIFGAEYKQISTIREISENIDIDTLVIFDINETLIMPDDCFLRATQSAKKYRISLEKSFDTNSDIYKNLLRKAWSNTSIKLIEEDMALFIKELKIRKIPMIALTGRFEEIEGMGEYTHDQLNSIGIDFSDAFREQSRFLISGVVPIDRVQPSFNQGVIFASDQKKGPVLSAFLDQIESFPKKIVVIDNRKSCLESIQTEL